MKKILAMIIATFVLIGCTIPAVYAESDQNTSAIVSYDVPDYFVLSIPSQIDACQPVDIFVPTLNLKTGRQVTVRAYGMDDDGNLVLTGVHDNNNTITARFYGPNGNVLKRGADVIGSYKRGDEAMVCTITSSVDYSVEQTVADTYQGVLYFTAYSEDIE